MAGKDEGAGNKRDDLPRAVAEKPAPLTDEQLDHVAGGGGGTSACRCKITPDKIIISPSCPIHGGSVAPGY
jgi:hypothetical protein